MRNLSNAKNVKIRQLSVRSFWPAPKSVTNRLSHTITKGGGVSWLSRRRVSVPLTLRFGTRKPFTVKDVPIESHLGMWRLRNAKSVGKAQLGEMTWASVLKFVRRDSSLIRKQETASVIASILRNLYGTDSSKNVWHVPRKHLTGNPTRISVLSVRKTSQFGTLRPNDAKPKKTKISQMEPIRTWGTLTRLRVLRGWFSTKKGFRVTVPITWSTISRGRTVWAVQRERSTVKKISNAKMGKAQPMGLRLRRSKNYTPNSLSSI